MPSQFTQQLAQQKPGFDFVAAHFACEQNLFSADNPDGFVNFGSAQNFLHPTSLQDRLSCLKNRPADSHYQAFSGTDSCRKSVANYLSHFSHPDPSARTSVSADHIILGNGIISLLEALATALLDKGDTVLVPTPVFPGLVNALSVRMNSQVQFLPVNSESDFRLSPNIIAKSFKEQADKGTPVKAMLLCSPGNPIGQVFGAEELQEIVSLAAEHNCALIVDEIYSGSCFQDETFVSTIGFHNPNVYVLGGLSKDFGLAGFATGWVHIVDDDVRRAVARQSHFFRLPAPVQTVVEHILDLPWAEPFLREHRSMLSNSYRQAVEILTGAGISVSSTESGLCLWVDLREFIQTADAAGELKLYQHLLNRHRVHISPGSGFFTSDFGFFRLCFSHEESLLTEGLKRLTTGLASA